MLFFFCINWEIAYLLLVYQAFGALRAPCPRGDARTFQQNLGTKSFEIFRLDYFVFTVVYTYCHDKTKG